MTKYDLMGLRDRWYAARLDRGGVWIGRLVEGATPFTAEGPWEVELTLTAAEWAAVRSHVSGMPPPE